MYHGPPLSRGSLREIVMGGKLDLSPTLQVIDVKRITPVNGQGERFRLVLSDGDNFQARHARALATRAAHRARPQAAMLATQLNEMVTSDRLVKFTVARVGECVCAAPPPRRLLTRSPPAARYLCNTVQNRKCVPRRVPLSWRTRARLAAGGASQKGSLAASPAPARHLTLPRAAQNPHHPQPGRPGRLGGGAGRAGGL